MRKPHNRIFAVIALALLSCASPRGQDAAAAVERFRLINLGETQMRQHVAPFPALGDVQLCQDFLDSDDDAARSWATLALSKLMRYPFYGEVAADRRAAINERLIAHLDHPHGDTAEWSARALRAAEQHGYLAAAERRTAARRALEIVESADPDQRRRATLVLKASLGGLPALEQPEIARTLMLALQRYPNSENDAEKTAACAIHGTLAQLHLGVTRAGHELMQLLLDDLERGDAFGFSYGKKEALCCLGRHINVLGGEARTRAVDLLVAGIGDRELLYMTTSGVRSPLLHGGAEALAEAWPHLRDEEQKRAKKAVIAVEQAWADLDEPDRASIFDSLELLVGLR